MNIISTDNLTKYFKNDYIIEKLNLNIKKGEIYGFIGNNGAGKTTTMKMLLGLSKPTSGVILLFNEDIKNNSILKRVGSNIEFPGFYGNLTAYENLMLFADLYGIKEKSHIEQLLEIGNLLSHRNKLVKKFSMGMKQRLGILRTLINSPELLILDEPINGLDPNGIKEIRKLLLNLNREKGITIMISSHILSEIEQMADRIGILHNGRLCKEVDMLKMYNIENKFIEIKVNDLSEAVKVLEKNLNIHSYEIRDDKIFIFERIEDVCLINKSLVDAGILVAKLYTSNKKLETYFLEVTNGKVS